MVGINGTQANTNNLLLIFPNPTHTQFTLYTNTNSKGTMQVTDQVGRRVMQKSFSPGAATFDCTALPKGLYFVKMTDNSNGKIKTSKLLVQ